MIGDDENPASEDKSQSPPPPPEPIPEPPPPQPPERLGIKQEVKLSKGE